MPRRRLFAAAAAGALALAALTGCRSDPTVAAYVDGSKITETQVDHMVDDAQRAVDRDNQATKGQQQPVQESVPSRTQVVGVLVAERLTQQVLSQRGITPQPVDESQVAQFYQVPATSAYASALATVLAGTQAIGQAVGAGYQPTDSDLRSVYDAAVTAGILPANTFDQAKPQLQQVQGLPQDLAARNELVKAEGPAKVTVNPRYRPLAYPVERLSTQSGSFDSVLLPLGPGASQPVVDTKPTATPSADQPPQQ
ncbi:hypothetical protein GCM10023322_05640 [Rugosimonospora acidiphila]|uniref:SurA N-terminal domain-containing protein n=1 Tax=Rugosimonospora acidiphila TaxID=556531 RepID=A0ABP9RJZ9_9ACTN